MTLGGVMKKSMMIPFGPDCWHRVKCLLSDTCDKMSYYARHLPGVDIAFFDRYLLAPDRRIDRPRGMQLYNITMRVSYRVDTALDTYYNQIDYSDMLRTHFARLQDYARFLFVIGVILCLDWDVDSNQFTYSFRFKS